LAIVAKSKDAAQVLAPAPSNFNLPMTPYVDEQTSQMNFEELVASQSSPEEFEAAYTRAETRSLESMSRCASPTGSQYSSYSSECPTPTSPTFGQNPFDSNYNLLQPGPFNPFDHGSCGYGPYGSGVYGQSFGPNSANPMGGAGAGNGGWGEQAYVPTADPYVPTFGRSRSCRW
jgi:hypothetical protein